MSDTEGRMVVESSEHQKGQKYRATDYAYLASGGKYSIHQILNVYIAG